MSLPRPGDCTLGEVGLRAILCTPTAAPPKWLIHLYPDILPNDADGTTRTFGARPHYCFSSPRYRPEPARDTRAIVTGYGTNPHIHAWQIDSEYGDHDTIYSHFYPALLAFRAWLAHVFCTDFWFMTCGDFAQTDLPNNLVDEPTLTPLIDLTRFPSDQIKAFNKAQVDLLRTLSPGRPIAHNFMQ